MNRPWGNFKWPYAKKCTIKDPDWTCLRWDLCLVASPGLWDLQVDLDLAENVDLLLYFKILHRKKETTWTNKYMDVISKDEPFRCESFSFFEQLGRKLIFFFLHKRSIFCIFPNFSWKFNIHSFHRLKWAMNRLFIFNIDRVISFLRLWSKHFLPDFSWNAKKSMEKEHNSINAVSFQIFHNCAFDNFFFRENKVIASLYRTLKINTVWSLKTVRKS